MLACRHGTAARAEKEDCAVLHACWPSFDSAAAALAHALLLISSTARSATRTSLSSSSRSSIRCGKISGRQILSAAREPLHSHEAVARNRSHPATFPFEDTTAIPNVLDCGTHKHQIERQNLATQDL
jgi:hypothetical protein